jgi:hypothetical protein
MTAANEDASQTIGQSSSSAAPSSGRSLVPSTNGDQAIDVDVDSGGEELPAGKRSTVSIRRMHDGMLRGMYVPT